MGYDVNRFQGEVDEDLICPICSGVLEEPVQVSKHLFGWGGGVGIALANCSAVKHLATESDA